MERKHTSTDRRLVAGLLMILAGGLLLLDSLGMLDFDLRHYLISWKTLLIFIGLITLSNRENRTTGFVLIGLGVMFWIPEMFDYRIRFSTIFWPAILIGIGMIILTRRGNRLPGDADKKVHAFSGNTNINESAQEYIEDTAIFGGGTTKFTSSNFRGGKLTAIFGGSDLHMNNAVPSPEGCVIDTLVIFGGSNLIVPDDWMIKSEIVSIFGGFSDKRMPATPNPEKTVVLKGLVLFGGVELKSY